MKNLLLGIFLLMGINSSAQETNNQLSLNFLIPSVEYEFSLGKQSSIDLNAGLAISYHYGFGESYFGVYVQTIAQYRYYYNFNKRIKKNKKVSENSGNYIAAMASFTPAQPIIGDLDIDANYFGVVGPVWGIQRVYESNFKLNLNLGVGYGFNSNESILTPIISFQLGFKLGKD